jgi:hypothetical protein
MKITLDIGEGKSCWGCNHLIQNLPVSGFGYGIPILPTCLIFMIPIFDKWRIQDLPLAGGGLNDNNTRGLYGFNGPLS